MTGPTLQNRDLLKLHYNIFFLITEDELPPLEGVNQLMNCEATVIEKLRPKLLSFHENRRPPYWGTWRKKSSSIKPRTPFGQDEVVIRVFFLVFFTSFRPPASPVGPILNFIPYYTLLEGWIKKIFAYVLPSIGFMLSLYQI